MLPPCSLLHSPLKQTLREFFSVVTAVNSSISELAGEVKGMKFELSLVHQDMQKPTDRTTALEGRFSTTEDEWQPLQ